MQLSFFHAVSQTCMVRKFQIYLLTFGRLLAVMLIAHATITMASQEGTPPDAQSKPSKQKFRKPEDVVEPISEDEMRRQLSLAIQDDNLSGVRAILRRSKIEPLSPPSNDPDGLTPFQEAVTQGSKKIIDQMMIHLSRKYGLCVAEEAYEEAIPIAIRAGGIQRARQLLWISNKPLSPELLWELVWKSMAQLKEVMSAVLHKDYANAQQGCRSTSKECRMLAQLFEQMERRPTD